MSQQTTPHAPETLIEAAFHMIDSAARKIVSFTPLRRGIRNVIRSQGVGLIGWDNVHEIAAATLELQKEKPAAISVEMTDQYQGILESAERQIADYTGLEAHGMPSKVEVFGQRDWIDANIVSFRFLFDPISEKYASVLEEVGGGGGARAQKFAHTVLSIQVGIIIGYMARNVLGQYDLSLPEPEAGGKLYVVEPNVSRVEKEMVLEPREFRQWITLHEVTHSFEFHCNDWLRDYLANSMQEYLKTIDWRGMSRPDLFRNLRPSEIKKNDALSAGGLIALIATPEQREILLRLQAIMCILEGYSNLAMDHVGEELLPSYPAMKERFEHRRENKSAAERLFQRLIGLDLKLQQYKLGQAFAEAVVEREGIELLNRVWESPELMPTMQEITSPDAWIERVKNT